VLILSHNIFNARSGTVIAVALTTQPQKTGFPLTLELRAAKFRKPTCAKISQLARVPAADITKVIDVILVKVRGEFVEHKHVNTYNFFLVLSGRIFIQVRDGVVALSPGEVFVVPKGVEHCRVAEEEAHILLIEPPETLNTGDAGTAEVRRVIQSHNASNRSQLLRVPTEFAGSSSIKVRSFRPPS